VIGGSLNVDRLLAAGFIAAFLILAFVFALLATRALEGQPARFLDAPRRLGSGDLSAPIQTSERDEFAALSEEFDRPRQSTGEDLEGPWRRDGAGAPLPVQRCVHRQCGGRGLV
jgi:HAMP domain-containing protein